MNSPGFFSGRAGPRRPGEGPESHPASRAAWLAAAGALGLMAAIFLFGVWSNTGRIAGSEYYADRFAGILPFGYAFAAGLVASVNPCGFLMLPAFVSYQLGTDDLIEHKVGPRHVARGLTIGVAVTLGFLALFSAIGAVIAGGGEVLIDTFPWAGFAVGILLVGLSVWLVLTGRSFGLAWAGRVGPPSGTGMGHMFLYGIAYGAVSLSCTLPIFLVVVGTSLATDGILPSLGQFISYSLGMGVVITAVSLGAASVKGAVASGLRTVVPHVHRLSAIFLAGAGAYLIVYWVWLGDLFG